MPRKRKSVRTTHHAAPLPAGEAATLARALGLSVMVYRYSYSRGAFWMFRDVQSGQEVGSWVEETGYCRALAVWQQVANGCAALRMVAAELRKRNPKRRAAA